MDGLLASEVILDEAMLYLDARCSKHFPTVEIRVADVCARRPRHRARRRARPRIRRDRCRGVGRRAAGTTRSHGTAQVGDLAGGQVGDRGTLLDPLTSRPRPAREVVTALVDHVRPALRASGDEALVTDRIDRVFVRRRSTRQREAFAETGHLGDVVAALAPGTVDQADRSPA